MPIAFGTSGLRGPATDFDAQTVGAYVTAFLHHIGAKPGESLFLGCDLRASSPAISELCGRTAAAMGLNVVWEGVTPTPAVALAALARSAPAMIVTGSHIPETYNGIKFYRRDGELLKDDEGPIRQRAEELLAAGQGVAYAGSYAPAAGNAAKAYTARYRDAFGPAALKGLRLGLFEHSAAGRDLLADIFVGLGAHLVRFGRSDTFVAVDTEALDPNSVTAAAREIEIYNLDAVVSTDGDGDRPLLIAASGRQINGDVLCALAARALGIVSVVTPLTSTSAIEQSGWFTDVVRTRIGSPYVVDAMQKISAPSLAGFEANGGFMLASPLALASGTLAPLPTRDAVLPLVALLAMAEATGRSVDQLAGELPSRMMKADRLKDIPRTLSDAFLNRVSESAAFRARLESSLAHPAGIDMTDGCRFVLADDRVVHFRASGNAPELRCYVETGSVEETNRLLDLLISNLSQTLQSLDAEIGAEA
jgi:phosphomannomutase